MLTPTFLLIAVVRVLGSLPVLRWPFAGGILAILVDLLDLILLDWLGAAATRCFCVRLPPAPNWLPTDRPRPR